VRQENKTQPQTWRANPTAASGGKT
jgi:hypothetical protein